MGHGVAVVVDVDKVSFCKELADMRFGIINVLVCIHAD